MNLINLIKVFTCLNKAYYAAMIPLLTINYHI